MIIIYSTLVQPSHMYNIRDHQQQSLMISDNMSCHQRSSTAVVDDICCQPANQPITDAPLTRVTDWHETADCRPQPLEQVVGRNSMEELL